MPNGELGVSSATPPAQPTQTPAGDQVGQPTAPQQNPGETPGNQLPWHPPKEMMYVAPRISFLVITGFFVMLAVLLWQEMHPSPVGVTDADARVAAALSATEAAAVADAAKQAAAKTSNDVQADSLKDQAAKDAAKNAADTADAAAKEADTKAADAKAALTQPLANTVPNGLQNVLFTLLGALGAAFTQVVNYWLGSSKGSADKTTFLANSVPLQDQSQGTTTPSASTPANQASSPTSSAIMAAAPVGGTLPPPQNEDQIDGCDVAVVELTADEDLPAAEGGVA